MKRLILIRHAKSSWKQPWLSDHDRPLNKRGNRSIELMQQQVSDQMINVDQIYSSSACRALSTAQGLQPVLCPEQQSITAAQLYQFNEAPLWQFVNELDDQLSNVALIGHNPALLDFTNELIDDAGDRLHRLPTCGLLQLELAINHWHRLSPGCGQLLYSVSPKQLSNGAN